MTFRLQHVDPSLELSKRIALIGSSNCLLKTKYGADIDQYDDVIRFNRGKPLIEYTLDVVVESFESVIFTTDSQEILRKADSKYSSFLNYTSEEEPAELATDTSKVIEVVSYLFDKHSSLYDQIWLCLPTCPLRTKEDVWKAQELLTDDVDGVLSITDYGFPPTLGLLKDGDDIINDWHESQPWQNGNTRSQDHPKVYRPNGAVYGMWCKKFDEARNFYKGKIRSYYMSRHKSVDIDEPIDLAIAKTVLNWL